MAEQKTSCFFKLSWAEYSRDKEPDIIKVANERATLLLREHAWMVTNHIPEVDATTPSCGIAFLGGMIIAGI